LERGQVVDILPDNYVKISMKRTEACAKCGACFSSGDEMTVIAYNADNAQISDWVNLSLESRYFLSAAFILYCLPLLALLIGAAGGYYGAAAMHLQQIGPVLGLMSGVILTCAVYLFIRAFEKKIKKSLYMPIAHMEINFH